MKHREVMDGWDSPRCQTRTRVSYTHNKSSAENYWHQCGRAGAVKDINGRWHCQQHAPKPIWSAGVFR